MSLDFRSSRRYTLGHAKGVLVLMRADDRSGIGVANLALTGTRAAARPASRVGRRLSGFFVICLAMAATSILWGFSPKGFLSNEDSWAPMRAAISLLDTQSAGRLYEALFFEQHVKFQYPPTSLLPLQVMDAVGTGRPRALNILNIVLVVFNAILVALLADTLLSWRLGLIDRMRWAMLALAGLSALVFYPIVRGLQLGQIQIWLDVAFTACCLLRARGADLTAGFAIGFGCLIKPQFLPLLLLGAVLRNWRFVAGSVLVVGSAGVISLWRYGLHNHLAYLEVLSFIGRHGESYFSNNSINGVINRWLGNGNNLEWSSEGFAPFHPLVFTATSINAAVFTVAPFLLRPSRGDSSATLLHFCFAALCFIMASPVAWEHHYGVLPAMFVIALSSILANSDETRRRPIIGALALAWIFSASKLSGIANLLSDSTFNPLQATQMIGGLILLSVMSVLLRPRAAERRR